MDDEQGRAPGGDVSVGVVGLGVIGVVHLDVLRALPGVSVAFGVDPRPLAVGGTAAQFPTLTEALCACPAPDVLVVATPTDTHLDLVAQALGSGARLVLSEKPLTRDAQQLRPFEDAHAGDLARLRVVNHFAFSPEVEWAVQVARRHGWGAPQRVFADFNDPYAALSPDQRVSYVSPWVDSGANQISMLSRLCSGWVVRAQDVDHDGLRAVTTVDHDGGSATLVTNWWSGASSKSTRLQWPGGQEVHLDHTAMTGTAVVDGRVVEHVGSDGGVERKRAHYGAMYRALFAGQDEGLLGLALAREVTEVLSAASLMARAPGRTTWTLGRPDGAAAGA